MDEPEVWEPADTALEGIFQQLPHLVGAPGVHLLWRRLAKYPLFLATIWPAVRASLQSIEIEECAQRLRASAFIVEAVGMPSHKAFRGDLVRAEIDADFRAKIENFNDLSHAGISRQLVLAVALTSAGTGAPVDEAGPAETTASRLSDDAVYVPPLRQGEAAGKAEEILERIGREHGLPFLDDYYRSLGRIPDFLSAAWNAIRPIVGDALYLDRAAELVRLADETAASLPAGAAVSAGMRKLAAEEARSIREMLGVFARQVLPQTLIDVTLIKALTSGPQHATSLAAVHSRQSDS